MAKTPAKREEPKSLTKLADTLMAPGGKDELRLVRATMSVSTVSNTVALSGLSFIEPDGQAVTDQQRTEVALETAIAIMQQELDKLRRGEQGINRIGQS